MASSYSTKYHSENTILPAASTCTVAAAALVSGDCRMKKSEFGWMRICGALLANVTLTTRTLPL